ncbi:unnamed protein product [Allacma fusca]|uniref:Uncharacterized protein n=1 Tax=Allacma fusca TaxID=39272 RepID=A0A8J2NZQ4_9HEXA|nr:unnamed protein product [Allacma fusca]
MDVPSGFPKPGTSGENGVGNEILVSRVKVSKGFSSVESFISSSPGRINKVRQKGPAQRKPMRRKQVKGRVRLD